jgi:acetolactate synthase-1/2/3 large subunit
VNVSDQIAQWLADKEIIHAFGIIGAGNISIFDAVARLGKTKVVNTHHEQAAAQAATYYYRTSKRLAPVLVTTGAGSANALTGVFAAFMDSQPLLVISGNEPSNFFKVSHPRVIGVQGYDSSEFARPMCKFAGQMNDKLTIQWLEDAYKVILTPRYGPAWIDVPRDVQMRKV